MIRCPHCKAGVLYLHWYRCCGMEIVKCLRCGAYKERQARTSKPGKAAQKGVVNG